MQSTRARSGGPGLPQWRMKVVLWAVGLMGLLLIGKLFYLQVLQSEFLGGRAREAHNTVRTLSPARGAITDRNGVTLAANRPLDRLFAEPKNIAEEHVEGYAAALAPIVGKPQDEIERLLRGDAPWVSLATRITPEQSAKVRALDLYAVGLESSPARTYPNGRLAAHVLGFTNYEGAGTYGVEGEYDHLLQGDPGTVTYERDPSGNWLAVARQQVTPARSGADVQLTLDSTIQYYAEQELHRVVREQDAKGGTIIVMRPTTGEILAMASAPDFAPGDFTAVRNPAAFTNPAISRIFEPGSTFKILTMAAGLAEGVITPDTRINDEGVWYVHGSKIMNWDLRPHPNESMTEVLMNSANVGAAWVSSRVGEDAYYKRLRSFGIGRPTGIDLQGEEDGILLDPSDPSWSPVNLYTSGYGQGGVAVTPLQLITAQSAVANGGLLMRPYVVSKVTRDGKVVRENKPTVIRRVLEPEVAETLKGMMQTVVEQGEYQVARMDGYAIGGKTGTASILKNGEYDPELTVASFIGYSPVEDPKFIVLVKVDEPKKSPWGSEVAAPAFKNLARRLYAYMNIPPENAGAASGPVAP